MSIESITKDSNGIVNLAIGIAFGLIVLGKFGAVTGVTTAANTAINAFITALGEIADWAGIIILIIVVVYMRKQMKKTQG